MANTLEQRHRRAFWSLLCTPTKKRSAAFRSSPVGRSSDSNDCCSSEVGPFSDPVRSPSTPADSISSSTDPPQPWAPPPPGSGKLSISDRLMDKATQAKALLQGATRSFIGRKEVGRFRRGFASSALLASPIHAPRALASDTKKPLRLQAWGPQIPCAIMAGTGCFLRAQPDGTVAPSPASTDPATDPACIFMMQKGGVALHMRVTIRSCDGRLLRAPDRVGCPATLGSSAPPNESPPDERERWQLVAVDRASEGAVYLKTHRASAECGPYLTCMGNGRPLVTAETLGEPTQQLFWPVDPAAWPQCGPPLAPQGLENSFAAASSASLSAEAAGDEEALAARRSEGGGGAASTSGFCASSADLEALSLASPVVAENIRCAKQS